LIFTSSRQPARSSLARLCLLACSEPRGRSGAPTGRPRPAPPSAGARWRGRLDGLHRESLHPRHPHKRPAPATSFLPRKATARLQAPNMRRLSNPGRRLIQKYSFCKASPPDGRIPDCPPEVATMRRTIGTFQTKCSNTNRWHRVGSAPPVSFLSRVGEKLPSPDQGPTPTVPSRLSNRHPNGSRGVWGRVRSLGRV
jgi:hypothetical protein